MIPETPIHTLLTECILWQGAPAKVGYGRFGKPRKYVHRLAWEFAFGDIPPGMFVCHKCDNRMCINPEHLFVGTPADNSADAAAKGRMRNWCPPERVRRGEAHRSAKLTRADVAVIRKSQEPHRAVAARYGVNPSVISRIKSGKSWRGEVSHV